MVPRRQSIRAHHVTMHRSAPRPLRTCVQVCARPSLPAPCLTGTPCARFSSTSSGSSSPHSRGCSGWTLTLGASPAPERGPSFSHRVSKPSPPSQDTVSVRPRSSLRLRSSKAQCNCNFAWRLLCGRDPRLDCRPAALPGRGRLTYLCPSEGPAQSCARQTKLDLLSAPPTPRNSHVVRSTARPMPRQKLNRFLCQVSLSKAKAKSSLPKCHLGGSPREMPT